MKKIHFIALQKGDIYKIVIIALISLVIVSINISYFSYYHNEFLISDASSNDSLSRSSENIDEPGRIAVIIEDPCKNTDVSDEFLAINKPITYALTPFLADSVRNAEAAHKNGYEVVTLIPYRDDRSFVNPEEAPAILPDMNRQRIYQLTMDYLECTPYSTGMSIYTENNLNNIDHVLSDILDVVKASDFYFIDDNPEKDYYMSETAASKGILSYKADVVLDCDIDCHQTFQGRLKKAKDIAIAKGNAAVVVKIGSRQNQADAKVLAQMLRELENENIELIFASDLFKNDNQ